MDVREPGAWQEHTRMRVSQSGYMVVHREAKGEKEKRPAAECRAGRFMCAPAQLTRHLRDARVS